ncbi:MAG: hypothetical protein HGA87_00735 [Desulfobulbaceae bacterium]|nr:hypothetical protein [Desulfobulbaceae bacterium]
MQALDHPASWFIGFLASTAWGTTLLKTLPLDELPQVPLPLNPMTNIEQLYIFPVWAVQCMVLLGVVMWFIMTGGIAFRLYATGYKVMKEGDAQKKCLFPGKCPYELYRKEEYGVE